MVKDGRTIEEGGKERLKFRGDGTKGKEGRMAGLNYLDKGDTYPLSVNRVIEGRPIQMLKPERNLYLKLNIIIEDSTIFPTREFQ